MTPQRTEWNKLRFSPIATDRRVHLGSTDEPPTQATFSYLWCHLGLIFRDEVTDNSHLLGSRLLQGSGPDSVALLVYRHWDRSPGIDIEITWYRTHPGVDLIMAYREKVPPILILAP